MIRKYITIIICFLSLSAFSQTGVSMPSELKVAFQKGDAKQLATFFNANIEVSILGVDDIYSKKQAEFVIQKFFRQHKPSKFIIKYQRGASNTTYVIADMIANEEKFKVVVLLKTNEKHPQIHQLRIENE